MRLFLTLSLLLAAATLPAQMQIPKFSRTYSSNYTRGFYFQSPAQIVITGVRVPDEAAGGRDILLYSAPDNPGAIEPHNGRIHMTVWASTDGAQSWPVKRLAYEGISVYSSVTADREGNAYLLFESGNEKMYDVIRLFRFDLEWLGLDD